MPLHHVPLKGASAGTDSISDSIHALFVQSWVEQNHSSGGFAQTDELVASRRSMGTVLPACAASQACLGWSRTAARITWYACPPQPPRCDQQWFEQSRSGPVSALSDRVWLQRPRARSRPHTNAAQSYQAGMGVGTGVKGGWGPIPIRQFARMPPPRSAGVTSRGITLLFFFFKKKTKQNMNRHRWEARRRRSVHRWSHQHNLSSNLNNGICV